MSRGEQLYLLLVVVSFVGFGVALALADWSQTQARRRAAPARVGQGAPVTG